MRFSVLRSLRRNWPVGVFGLLATVGLVAAALRLIPANFVTTSQMVLLPPLSQPNANYNGVVNPYMGLAGLQSMADVVSSAMMDDDTAKALEGVGVTKYSVAHDSLSAAPILIVQVTEPTAAQANSAITALDRQIPLTVARLQGEAAISPKSFITTKLIASPSLPARSGKTQLRAAVLALVVGVVLTLLTASLFDAWRIRRRSRPADNSYDHAATVAPPADDQGYKVLANEAGRDRAHPLS
jgi:hypothetical protein